MIRDVVAALKETMYAPAELEVVTTEEGTLMPHKFQEKEDEAKKTI